MLKAVEKDVYPNLDSAMKSICSIYTNVLKSITSSKPNLKVSYNIYHNIISIISICGIVIGVYSSSGASVGRNQKTSDKV